MGYAHLFENHPKLAVLAVLLGTAMAVLMIWSLEADRPRRTAENVAWYRAKLECRQSGGSYEQFGPEGWVCIGGKKP
jgi:hypothetical protein